MLNIIKIQQDIVAHLEGQVDLLNLTGRILIRRILRIERGHLMADRRPVDLHED